MCPEYYILERLDFKDLFLLMLPICLFPDNIAPISLSGSASESGTFCAFGASDGSEYCDDFNIKEYDHYHLHHYLVFVAE